MGSAAFTDSLTLGGVCFSKDKNSAYKSMSRLFRQNAQTNSQLVSSKPFLHYLHKFVELTAFAVPVR